MSSQQIAQKDITSSIKSWMFKQFRDETFEGLKSDAISGRFRKYEDPYFPPTADSLGDRVTRRFKDLIWRRACDFIEAPNKLEVLNLSTAQNVNQGRIGDCYLLNPIGLLATIQKPLIARLFTIREPNAFGYYGVWLFIDGKWKHINVDETFPWWTTRKKPYFCDIVDGTQIWPMIIEKAWAKLHGEYSRLWGGDTGLALRVITGAPTKSYGLKKFRKDPRKKDSVFKAIHFHLNKGHLISVTTGALDDHARTFMTQGHSYALIGYKPDEKKFIIRDPRGPTNVFGKDIYEIEEGQMIYLFQCVIVSVLEPSNLFTEHSLIFDGQSSRSENLTKLVVSQRMQFFFSIYQPNKRYFRDASMRKQWRTCKLTIKILKVEFAAGEVTKAKSIASKSAKSCVVDFDLTLAQGTYYVYIGMTNANSQTETITLNCCAYAAQYVEFKDPPSNKKLNALKTYFEVQKAKNEENLKKAQQAKLKNNAENKLKKGKTTSTTETNAIPSASDPSDETPMSQAITPTVTSQNTVTASSTKQKGESIQNENPQNKQQLMNNTVGSTQQPDKKRGSIANERSESLAKPVKKTEQNTKNNQRSDSIANRNEIMKKDVNINTGSMQVSAAIISDLMVPAPDCMPDQSEQSEAVKSSRSSEVVAGTTTATTAGTITPVAAEGQVIFQLQQSQQQSRADRITARTGGDFIRRQTTMQVAIPPAAAAAAASAAGQQFQQSQQRSMRISTISKPRYSLVVEKKQSTVNDQMSRLRENNNPSQLLGKQANCSASSSSQQVTPIGGIPLSSSAISENTKETGDSGGQQKSTSINMGISNNFTVKIKALVSSGVLNRNNNHGNQASPASLLGSNTIGQQNERKNQKLSLPMINSEQFGLNKNKTIQSQQQQQFTSSDQQQQSIFNSHQPRGVTTKEVTYTNRIQGSGTATTTGSTAAATAATTTLKMNSIVFQTASSNYITQGNKSQQITNQLQQQYQLNLSSQKQQQQQQLNFPQQGIFVHHRKRML